jgi:hypothetical protein
MGFLLKHRPSPAMVVASIALTVALGGTSYAAIKLPKNSVGAKQLKKNAVTRVKVKANAITSPKVAANSLTGADVLESSLAQVPSAATAVTASQATTAGTAAPSGPAAGGLAGTYPNPTIGADAVGSANIVDAAGAAGLRKADIAAVSTTVSFDPPSIAAHNCSSDAVAVTGAQTGDVVIAHPVSTVWSNLVYMPWTVTGNLVYMRFCNPTASATDGSALPFYVLLIR